MRESSEPRWRQITLYLLTAALFVICGFMLKPFFTAIVGAIVLAVISQGLYRWLAAKISNTSLCAAITMMLVVLILVVPIYLMAQNLTEQAVDVVSSFRSEAVQEKIADYFVRHPALAARINAVTNALNLENTTRSVATFLGGRLAGLIGRSFGTITQIVLMLFILFFLLRDRDLALNFVRSNLPLRDVEADRLIHRVGDTVYATALERLVVAGVQGTLAGLAYWILGVPNPLFWGLLTAAMSVIPAFGAFLVWVPVALYLGFNGHWAKAALLAVWGGGVVSTIDNFLYPILIGPRLRQHTVVVLISILGGIAVFGITGIVLGPVVVTVLGTLLEIWKGRVATEEGVSHIADLGR